MDGTRLDEKVVRSAGKIGKVSKLGSQCKLQ